ncbi:hypothetical protein ACMFMG_002878 [Clarireedia jacksonii]
MAAQAPTWSWDIPELPSLNENQHSSFSACDEPAPAAATAPEPEPKRRKHYPPRTCRICLETVLPIYETPSEGLASMLNPTPRVEYKSEDDDLGRLIRPCKCKGTQKYVHEGCLQAWRYADPYGLTRNYWECPTCKAQYRLQRMTWRRWITSTFTQLCLTVSALLVTIFILGYVADPIINFYLDPVETVTSFPTFGGPGPSLHFVDDEPGTWTEHLLKGLASLGLLGFVKVFFVMSPWQWWNIRATGVFGGGTRAGTGRGRLENISWTLVIIGVLTFLVTVWKWTRQWSRAVLERAGDNIVEYHGDDDDEDDEEETQENQEQPEQPSAEIPLEGAGQTPVDPETRKNQ